MDFKKNYQSGAKQWSQIWSEVYPWTQRKQLLMNWHKEFTPWIHHQTLPNLINWYKTYKNYPLNKEKLKKKKLIEENPKSEFKKAYEQIYD